MPTVDARIAFDSTMRALLLLVSLPVGVAATPAAAPPPASELDRSCRLSGDATAWVQKALDGWEWVLSETLEREPRLPWIVLFDGSCVFELGAVTDDPSVAPLDTALVFSGGPVEVRAKPHRGTIVLPNGQELPPAPIASGFLRETEEGVVPFFALAMIDIWRREARAAEQPRLESFFLGVAIHEMVHTLQLVDLDRRVAELETQYELPPSLDDDVVQHTFEDVAGFREAFEAERDLFYRAAQAEDEWSRRALASAAISLLDERRARYFREERAFFTPLEDLFLNLEGLAVWSHFRLALDDPRVAFLPDLDSAEPAELIEHARQGQGYWSQEEGFALFLLLDRMVPGWRPRVLGPELVSPVWLLRQALEPSVGALASASRPPSEEPSTQEPSTQELSTQEVNDRTVEEWAQRIAGREDEPAARVFENIQIEWLEEIPAARFLRIMNFGYSRALGVRCTHCHVEEDFASDDKRPKRAAREMASLHRLINGRLQEMQNLEPKPEQRAINCSTCHRGKIDPMAQDR